MQFFVKKILPKFFLIILGVLLALSLGEVLVRKFNPQLTFSNNIYPYDFHCFIKGNDYYWLKLKPNSNCLLKSNGGYFEDVYFKTNSLGLRSPEISPQKAENTLRILFLGDSYTIGWGVRENQAFPRVVEKNLQQIYPDKKIEVINAGLIGTGPSYDYLFYKNEGINLKPDIVVVGTYLYNDIPEDLFLSKWEEDENGLPKKAQSTFFYVDSNGMFYPRTNPLKYRLPYLRESQLFMFLMNRFPSSPASYEFNSKFLDPHICFYKEKCHDLDQTKLKAKKLFSAINDLTVKNNQKLLVVFIPAEFQIDAKTRISYLPIPLLPSEKNYPYQYFKDFFKEKDIDNLDLRPYLKDYNKGELYIGNDDHFNALGHRITAGAITEKLHNLIEGRKD